MCFRPTLKNFSSFYIIRHGIRLSKNYCTEPHVKLRQVSPHNLREITRIKGKDGSITIEGKLTPVNPNQNDLVLDSHSCCPLCSLNLEVDYTDVLILRQFIRKDGGLIARRDTGLCASQQVKVAKLVHKAANAGLLTPYQPPLADGEVRKPRHEKRFKFKGLNRYFTDKY